MATLFDYLDWRGDLPFSAVPLNEVDNLILSQIAYMDWADIVPRDASVAPISLLTATRKYLKLHKGEAPYLGKIVPPDIVSLTARAAKSRRFGDLQLTCYINRINDETQSQFSALTALLHDEIGAVIFRGTDDTLVGWKENFNMSFLQPVPAQLQAVDYLEQVLSDFPHDFYVGGHSKGGNLAVYAAVKCDPQIKDRLLTVFNNDGPGFSRDFIEGGDYLDLRGKIRTIVPHSSVVGMLLEHEETYEVVKSNAVGILQHNGFSWEVMGGQFIHLDTVSGESRRFDSSLKEWLGGMSAEERENFVDSIYETVTAVGAKTLTELTADKVKLVKAWGTLDAKSRSVILKCLSLLIRQGGKAKKQ